MRTLFFVWAMAVLYSLASGQLVCSSASADEPRRDSYVVLYCAQDEFLAEPLLKEFTRRTGCEVRTVYDSEAVKTVGLANRLLAERGHPGADVFWGNEEFRTRWLASKGVFVASNGWSAFGRRSRRLVINTNRLSAVTAPKSLEALTNAAWRGKVSIAYPSFGTTATHLLVLRADWGPERWSEWCRALAANAPFLEEGNSEVVARVGRGQAWIGLTDSDDIAAGCKEGLPIQALPQEAWSLDMPNTVAIVQGARHPGRAEELRQFLIGPPVQQRLIEAGGMETPQTRADVLRPNWERVLSDFTVASDQLEKLFRR